MPKDIIDNVNNIKFNPDNFHSYLLNEVGFEFLNTIDDYFALINSNNSKRNIIVYKKN